MEQPLEKISVGLLQNIKSKIAGLFSFQNIDEHYVIKFFGLKFCKKHSYHVNFKEVTEYGLTTEKRSPRIIVALTTFPGRINLVYKTISTLLQQTLKPDELVLWLTEDDFPTRELPENVTRLQQYGLTIKWCEKIKSFKKVVPTIREYPNDIIVAFDDDYYYDTNVLKNLYEDHLKYPDCIICARSMRLVPRLNGKLKLTRRSYIYDDSYLPSYLNPSIGYSGVFYPPKSLHSDVTDTSKFMTIIPTNDDAWFWVNAVRNKTKLVTCSKSYDMKFYTVEHSQDVGLYKINTGATGGMCGEDAANMFLAMYPDAKEIIESAKK